MENNEWDVADNNREFDRERWGIRVCPQCYGDLVGHWGDGVNPNRGGLCWRYHRIDGPGILIEWPRELKCRACGKVETREETRKYYLTPFQLNAKEGTHLCRCTTPDSSD